MARNGSGTYSRLYSWVADAASALKISSSRMDADTDDIAAAITASIAKDGQTTPTANLPMGGFKHTNVATGTARMHYLPIGQHQDGGTLYGGTATGTNTIVATLSPAITAYAAGQVFSFKSAASNTGAATVNFNGVGAKTIKRADGSDLRANDIIGGQLVHVQYGSTSMQLLNNSFNGALLGIQYLTSSGTYTPTAGTALGVAHLQAGGGGGAGKSATGVMVGGGGGSGAYAIVHLANPAAQAYTIGAGGAAGNAATGTAGGSTVMASVTCSGGGGGTYKASGGADTDDVAAGGAAGTVSGGSPSFSAAGQKGGTGWYFHLSATSTIRYFSGAGGNSHFGQGGQATGSGTNTGIPGSGYGSGGSGACCDNGGQSGGLLGTGADGIIIVYEFA